LEPPINEKEFAIGENHECNQSVGQTRYSEGTDSLGEVDVPSDKMWGAQTQRPLEHFNIGQNLIPREMIAAFATLKKAAANANFAGKRLDDQREIALSPQFLPLGAPTWKAEHGVEFNTLLDPLPMLLLQPVIQYYANMGGRVQRAVVFGFRAKVEF